MDRANHITDPTGRGWKHAQPTERTQDWERKAQRFGQALGEAQGAIATLEGERDNLQRQLDSVLRVANRLCDSLDRNEILIPPDALRVLSETQAAIAAAEGRQP